MDERAIILNSLQKSAQDKAVKAVKASPDSTDSPDSLDKLIKKKIKQQRFKTLGVEDWSNVDFMNYIDTILKGFGVMRKKNNPRVDSDTLNRIYDHIATKVESISNKVLKEYIDWWMSIWACRLAGQGFDLRLMLQEKQIGRFVTRYGSNLPVSPILNKTNSTTDDVDIYELGGLDLLIMKKGIVQAYAYLKNRHNSVETIKEQIKKTLSALDKDVLSSVIHTTIRNAPYSQEYAFDFVSLVASLVEKYKLAFTFNELHTYFIGDKKVNGRVL